MANYRKYRMYRLRQVWYGQCPHCPTVKINGVYDQLLDLLQLHAKDKHPETLDTSTAA